MAPLDNPSIPKGSIVLVTGASGLIASNIVDQFLHYGYKVRGTVRDPKKSAWLAKLFDEKYGKENFELVAVPEMMAEGAFDEAVKGADSHCHRVATADQSSRRVKECPPLFTQPHP
jgi:nucleoside-diphosphate-sugar epimerase